MPIFTPGIAPSQAASIISMSGSQFNILTANADNSAGFALLAYWMLTASEGFGDITEKIEVVLPPGVFLVSGAVMDLTRRTIGGYTPRLILRGAGTGSTVIRSTAASTSKCVFQVLAGYAAFCVFEDFSIQTRTDVTQDALHFVCTRRPLDNTGGMTAATLRRIGITSDWGDACVFMGGDDYLGPNQFLLFEMCTFVAKRKTALKTYGQFGQVNITNGWYDGVLSLSACPSVAICQDLRLAVEPTAVNTTNNFITTGPEVPTGTPFRFIGSNVPSGVFLGTTYYLRRYDIANDTANNKFTVHSSLANVVSDTRVALGSSGALGNWRISPLYVTSVSDNALNFEFPHLLVDCAIVYLVGTSLPTGLSTSTAYYVVRTAVDQIKLASSKANALTGTTLTFSGGTVTGFGLSTDGFNTGEPYSVNFSTATIQDNMVGLYLSGARDVIANLHIENSRNALHVFNSQLVVLGGSYQNPSDDGGRGVLLYMANPNTRVTVIGIPRIIGAVDNSGRLITKSGGSYYSGADGWDHAVSSSSTSKSIGLLAQYGVSTSTDFGADTFVFVNGEDEAPPGLQTILSKLPPFAELNIMAWGGSFNLQTGGNISLPNSTTILVPTRGVVTLKRIDTVGTWALIGRSF